MLTERNLCWVAGVGQSNLLAINHQGITISLHSSIVLAMNSVLNMTNMFSHTTCSAASTKGAK